MSFTSLPPVTTTNETVTGLNPSTSYDFEVQATNAVGNSGQSTIVTVVTPASTSAPTPPTNLATTAVASTSVNLTWTASTGTAPISYQVQFSLTGANTWSNGPLVTVTNAQVTSLTVSTGYDFRVIAQNSIGNSQPSTVLSNVVTASSSPTVTWKLVGPSSITLSSNALTATAGGSSVAYSTPQGCISTTANGTGSYWFEVTFTGISQNTSIGLAGANFNVGGTQGGGDANAISYYPSTGTNSQPAQSVYYNNVPVLSPSGNLPAADTPTFTVTCLVNINASTGAGTLFVTSPAMQAAYNNGATFADEFTGLPLHQFWQSGDNWGIGATFDNGLGQGGPWLGDFGQQWWVNPFNPNTAFTNTATNYAGGIYQINPSGTLELGLYNTPSSMQTYINNQSQASGGLPYIGGLLNNQNLGTQQFGYWEFQVAVDKLPGFDFQFDIESYNASTNTNNPPEIDVRIYTNANNVQNLVVAIGGYGTLYSATSPGFDASVQHIYGLNWQADFVTFYVDGSQVAQVATSSLPAVYASGNPMFAYLLTGAHYNSNTSPAAASLPKYAHVQYVRVYNTKPTGASGGQVWNDSNTANPGANTGGIPFTIPGPLSILLETDEAGAIATLNAGSSAPTGTIPSQYLAWNGGVVTVTAPTQPTGLTVGTIASTTVALSWTAPGTGTAPFTYTVQQSPHNAGTWTTATTTNNVTSATVTGLTPSTAYDFRVLASNTAGTSPASGVVSATTLAQSVLVPGAPGGVSVTANSTTQLTTTWQEPTTGGQVGGTSGGYTVLYRKTGTSPFTSLPLVRVVTPGNGVITAGGQTWQVVAGANTLKGAYLALPNQTPYANDLSTYTAAMGQPPAVMDAFLDDTTGWGSGIQNSASFISGLFKGLGYIPTFAIPMAMTADSSAASAFAAINAGTHDADFNAMFASFVSNGFASCNLRPGWEMNLAGWPWTVDGTTIAAYVQAFQRIASMAHSYPGANFKMVWCPNANSPIFGGINTFYPGDTAVDMISIDQFGPGAGGPALSQMTENDGVNWSVLYAANMAVSHNKLFCMDEVTETVAGSPAFCSALQSVLTSVRGLRVDHISIVNDPSQEIPLADATAGAAWLSMFNAVATWSANSTIYLNGAYDGISLGVSELTFINGLIWQNAPSGWYSVTPTATVPPPYAGPVATPPWSEPITGLTAATSYDVEVQASNAAGNGPASSPIVKATTLSQTGSGAFTVTNGQIIGPNGQAFVARGFAVWDAQLSQWSPSQILAKFPRCNSIRLSVGNANGGFLTPLLSWSAMQNWINQATALGIVVILDDHQQHSGTPPYTGGNLTTDLAYVTQVGNTYKNQPLVWIQSMNEPGGGGPLAVYHQAFYNAFRATGATNIVLHDGYGGNLPNPPSDQTGPYQSMYNCGWDGHFYNWMTSGNTNQSQVNSQLNSMIAGWQGFTNFASGPSSSNNTKPPVWVGECGFIDYHGNSQVDAGGGDGTNQVVIASLTTNVTNGGLSSGTATWLFDGTAVGFTPVTDLISGTTITQHGQVWNANA